MSRCRQRRGRSGERGRGSWVSPHHPERGQIIVVFALSMALFLFVIFCAVIDLDYLFSWSARVQAAAQVAAQSGANTVDPNYLYNPASQSSVIDQSPDEQGRPKWEHACAHNGNASAGIVPPDGPPPPRPGWAVNNDGTRCRTNGCQVAATVIKNVTFPVTLLGLGAQVKGTGQAGTVVGADKPAAAGQPACSAPPAPP